MHVPCKYHFVVGGMRSHVINLKIISSSEKNPTKNVYQVITIIIKYEKLSALVIQRKDLHLVLCIMIDIFGIVVTLRL